MARGADVLVRDEGTVVGFKPTTRPAKAWFDENVAAEGWQWLGGYLYVDHRMAEPLIEGIEEAGMSLAAG